MNTKVPPNIGRKTVESFITVCQCGGFAYDVKKRNKTNITMQCRECGTITSVKGNIAHVRIDAAEVAYAIKERVVRPNTKDVEQEPAVESGGEKKQTLAEQGYATLRFRLSEDQRAVVMKALEVVRVLNWGNESYRAVKWHGLAMEHIVADFLSGADKLAIEVVDAAASVAEQEIADWKDKNPDKEIPSRKVNQIRGKARQDVAERLGVWANDKYKPSKPTDDEKKSRREYKNATMKKKEEQSSEDRLVDDGKMYRLLSDALVEHCDDLVAGGGKRPSYLIVKPDRYKDVLSRWRDSDGVLLMLRGDTRTMDKAGSRPTIYLWCDSVESVPEVAVMYDDIYEDQLADPQLEVIEIVEKGSSGHGVTELLGEV